MRQWPDVLKHLSEVAAIHPSAATATYKVVALVGRIAADSPPDAFPAPYRDFVEHIDFEFWHRATRIRPRQNDSVR
jgi:hypothetical protein